MGQFCASINSLLVARMRLPVSLRVARDHLAYRLTGGVD